MRSFLTVRLFVLALIGAVLPWPAALAEVPGKHRILVIGSALAEIIVALGASDEVVGRDAGTDHIAELAQVPRIPGFRQTSAEGMLSLRPTLVLLNERRARAEVVDQLRGAGVAVHLLGDGGQPSLEIVPARVHEIAGLIGRTEAAPAVVARFEAEMAAAKALVATTASRPAGLFILSGGGRPTLVAGGDTHIALLIELAGGRNVTNDISYFKPMSQEAMIAAAPEFILVNKEGLEQAGGVAVALKAPGAQLTPAGQTGNLISLPSGYLSDFGLMTPRAIEALARQIHPELRKDGK